MTRAAPRGEPGAVSAEGRVCAGVPGRAGIAQHGGAHDEEEREEGVRVKPGPIVRPDSLSRTGVPVPRPRVAEAWQDFVLSGTTLRR
jgi:hypothetical protein